MARVALVANLGAGGGLGAAELEAALERAGAEVQTFGRGEATRAAASGAARLVVAGGDGSIGPVAAAAGAAGLPLAVLPVGTANNFAHVAGIPPGLDDACALAAGGARLRGMELGRAGELPFVNLASAGLAPVAARRAERWKPRLGPAAYSVGAATAALGTPTLECTVAADGAPAFEGRAWQVMVAVSGGFGAGVRVEAADTGDGWLDLVVMEAGPRFKLAARAYRMRRGQLAPQPGVSHRRGRTFDVDVAPGTEFNVDGEVVPLGPARFSVERVGFQLIVP